MAYRTWEATVVHVLAIQRGTMGQAEDAIAMLWRMLEQYRVPTPRLRVSSGAGAVHLMVEFQSDQDAHLMRRVTPELASG